MKVSLGAVTLMVSAGLVISVPSGLYTRDEVELSGLPTGVLTWRGKVTRDGDMITLNGTAESIHDQILDLNPRYLSQGTQWVEGRDHAEAKYRPEDGRVNCTTGAVQVNDFYEQCNQSLYSLKLLGGWCTAPGGQCTLISCSLDCGTYICSNVARDVRCASIAADAEWINQVCGDSSRHSRLVRGRLTYESVYAVEVKSTEGHCYI